MSGVRPSVRIFDENLQPAIFSDDGITGVNLVGAPYVLAGKNVIERARLECPASGVLVGGQVVAGFKKSEFVELFGAKAINGTDLDLLAQTIGVRSSRIPPAESTALNLAFDLLPPEVLRTYMEREFSLYLSQGCRYSCTFCAATRNRRPGASVPVREVYRSMQVLESELVFLLSRAASFGLGSIRMYLSNLDLFQSPRALQGFASVMSATCAKFPQLTVEMRGLSTSTSFLRVHTEMPELIHYLVSCGLRRIGFGIDGAEPRVWRRTRKPANGTGGRNAVRIATETYGLETEALMVFGHVDADDKASLRLACEFLAEMGASYGSLPRPHVAKAVVPGNDGWYTSAGAATVAHLLDCPEDFQNLDFTTLPSRVTHGDPEFRTAVAEEYLRACGLPGNLTMYTLPVESASDAAEREAAIGFNTGRYDI